MRPATVEPASRPGPIPGILGRIASRAYAAAIAHRNRAFDAGRGVESLPVPVVSVGNLSVGGTGKTPMVAHLCRLLLDSGHYPCIAMRGYGAAKGESDEARIYAHQLPGVPVVAQPNRTEGLMDLFASEPGDIVDCIVLDDGFQHRQLARDLDIVLIDATRDPWSDRLLPAGWLREGPQSLSRAHAIIITHSEAADAGALTSLRSRAREASPTAILASCRHFWDGLLDAAGTQHPVSILHNTPVAACCAIGNPDAFIRQVRAASTLPLAAERILRDHDPFAPGTIASLLIQVERSGAKALVVTEKDWAKLSRVKPDAWPCPVYRPRLRLQFDSGGPELDQAVLRIAATAHAPE